ncbi:MAG: hypothetical protein WDN48_01570 [Pseudolabrys sp.]
MLAHELRVDKAPVFEPETEAELPAPPTPEPKRHGLAQHAMAKNACERLTAHTSDGEQFAQQADRPAAQEEVV